MRIISITNKHGDISLINPNQITRIWDEQFQGETQVLITLSCGHLIRTKFTTVDHALDYIQRASSHSLVGG